MSDVSLPIMGEARGVPGGSPPTRGAFDALGRAELLERFEGGVALIDPRVLKLPGESADTFFRAEAGVGRWSCRVVLGHLADAEVVFAHRFRRTAAEDGPVLPGWDQDAFIDAGLYTGAPLAGFVAVMHTMRKFSGEWLATLGDAAWGRPALSTTRGERTLGLLVADAAWHLEHHAWFLNAKVARLLGPGERDGA